MRIPNNLIISFLVTSIYIISYIWNRFIRIRLPKEVYYHEIISLQDKITIIICFVYLFLFSYYTLKYFQIIPRPNSKFKRLREKFGEYLKSKKIITKFLEKFNEHVMNAPKNIYNYFYMFIYIRPFIWSCAQFLHIHFEMKPIIPYICFFILPRFIIAIVLLIEVIFFNYIRCFYNLLGLLVIPLLFKIILLYLNK